MTDPKPDEFVILHATLYDADGNVVAEVDFDDYAKALMAEPAKPAGDRPAYYLKIKEPPDEDHKTAV